MKNFKCGTFQPYSSEVRNKSEEGLEHRTESFNASPVWVVLFVSRNKDQAGVPDFKERRMSFLTHDAADSERLQKKFDDFVRAGVPGELCRMYISVNARDPKKIYTQLMHFLFDNPDFNLCDIMPKLAGIAAQKECASQKQFMFDFDIDDEDKLREFLADIQQAKNKEPVSADMEVTVHKTPHGYAVITSRGFDTRELLSKWGENVTLKRDDLLCVDWKKSRGREKEVITLTKASRDVYEFEEPAEADQQAIDNFIR